MGADVLALEVEGSETGAQPSRRSWEHEFKALFSATRPVVEILPYGTLERAVKKAKRVADYALIMSGAVSTPAGKRIASRSRRGNRPQERRARSRQAPRNAGRQYRKGRRKSTWRDSDRTSELPRPSPAPGRRRTPRIWNPAIQ
jgi:hypothetical protein